MGRASAGHDSPAADGRGSGGGAASAYRPGGRRGGQPRILARRRRPSGPGRRRRRGTGTGRSPRPRQLAMARHHGARLALRPARPAPQSHLHRRRSADAGARRRREYRRVQRARRCAAEIAAVPGCRTSRRGLAHRPWLAWPGYGVRRPASVAIDVRHIRRAKPDARSDRSMGARGNDGHWDQRTRTGERNPRLRWDTAGAERRAGRWPLDWCVRPDTRRARCRDGRLRILAAPLRRRSIGRRTEHHGRIAPP